MRYSVLDAKMVALAMVLWTVGMPNAHAAGLIGTAGSDLYAVDSTSGSGTLIAPVTSVLNAQYEGLAFDPNSGTLYAAADYHLVAIDPATGASTVIGAFGGGYSIDALAYDPNTNTLFAAQHSNPNLLSIDTGTGTVSVVGSYLLFNRSDRMVTSLAFDAASNTLYGTYFFDAQLITINPLTGEATAVGQTQYIRGLAFEPANNLLYATNSAGQTLTIDPTTAATVVLGPIGDVAGGSEDIEIGGLARIHAIPAPLAVVLIPGLLAVMGLRRR